MTTKQSLEALENAIGNLNLWIMNEATALDRKLPEIRITGQWKKLHHAKGKIEALTEVSNQIDRMRIQLWKRGVITNVGCAKSAK